ncbi:MAG: hypothetical protein IJT91_04175 [Clostridia bacterium]|nr:hypothetical protein [Clostridia bacterium]
MEHDPDKTIRKITSMSDGELRRAIESIAENLKLDRKTNMLAKRLAANPAIIRAKLAKTPPEKLASLFDKLTDEQKRELEKHIGGQ